VIVVSPCIGDCKLDDDEVCKGCKRTIKEITGWSNLGTQQKQNILIRLENQKLDTHLKQKLDTHLKKEKVGQSLK